MKRSIRGQIHDFFNYCGDVDGVYSEGYSPNNIKRLIVYPMGFELHLHKAVKVRGSIRKRLRFMLSESMWGDWILEMQDVRYKPVYRELLNPVCSSLEEIIVVSDSQGVFLPEFADVSYFGEGLGMGLGGLLRRFGRLRVLSFFQWRGDIMDRVSAVKDRDLGYDCLTDRLMVEGLKVVRRQEFAKEWYNFWGNQSVYSLDSILSEYFKAVREDVLKEKGDAAGSGDADGVSGDGLSPEDQVFVRDVLALAQEYAGSGCSWVRDNGGRGALMSRVVQYLEPFVESLRAGESIDMEKFREGLCYLMFRGVRDSGDLDRYLFWGGLYPFVGKFGVTREGLNRDLIDNLVYRGVRGSNSELYKFYCYFIGGVDELVKNLGGK